MTSRGQCIIPGHTNMSLVKFKEIFYQITISDNQMLVSFDFKSLFTSIILLNLAVGSVKRALEQYGYPRSFIQNLFLSQLE